MVTNLRECEKDIFKELKVVLGPIIGLIRIIHC